MKCKNYLFPPNPSSLDVKVGEEFSVKSIVLPLEEETSMLMPRINYSNGLEILTTEVKQLNLGQFYEVTYKFKAISEGWYNIDLYFAHRSSKDGDGRIFSPGKKWIPSEDSEFKGKSEQTIEVTVK